MFKWPPPKPRVALSVVVPSSNLLVYKDLRLKTRMVGDFSRSAAIFRVSTLAVYRDPDSSEEDHRLFVKVAKYMMIPPYLRVRVQALDPDLRFAGLLPPLSTYPQNPENRPLSVNDIRFGLVLNEYGLVDVGWRRPCKLSDYGSSRRGEVILVRVASLDPLICNKLDDSPIYAGYSVVSIEKDEDLARFVNSHEIVVDTSKSGTPLWSILEDPGSLSKLRRARSICLLFGNPWKDFRELVEAEIRTDFTVNFIPHQGTLTVRTLEATLATLAVLNIVLRDF